MAALTQNTPAGDTDQPYAALDLGSNSFHLIVAYDHGDRLQVVDRHKETVRLAEGLAADNSLEPTVVARALACLKRLGQRVRDLPPGNVRVVGTNTLRKARNSQDFIDAAEGALGHRVEIISGREEARLIYLGVSHSLEPLEDSAEARLVVDIGGGSTELILGRQFPAASDGEPLHGVRVDVHDLLPRRSARRRRDSTRGGTSPARNSR